MPSSTFGIAPVWEFRGRPSCATTLLPGSKNAHGLRIIERDGIELIEGAGRLLLEPPAIRRHRYFSRRMTKLLLDVHGADAIGEQDGRIGMAQAVRGKVLGCGFPLGKAADGSASPSGRRWPGSVLAEPRSSL